MLAKLVSKRRLYKKRMGPGEKIWQTRPGRNKKRKTIPMRKVSSAGRGFDEYFEMKKNMLPEGREKGSRKSREPSESP